MQLQLSFTTWKCGPSVARLFSPERNLEIQILPEVFPTSELTPKQKSTSVSQIQLMDL